MRRSHILLVPLLVLIGLHTPLHAEEESESSVATAVAVPDVKGLSESDAVDKLQAAGFHADVVSVAGSCPNLVADQWPAAGVAHERGANVRVKLCVPVTVVTKAPDVVGKREQDVLAALEPIYYVERVYVAANEDEPAGTIVEQAPAGGTDLPYRGQLFLRVAAQPVKLPALLGMHVHDATVRLESAGLEVHLFHTDDGSEEAGTVVSQLPGTGTEMLPGGIVTLGVAGRPGPTTEPDEAQPAPEVRGLGLEAAYAAVLEAGFVPHTTFVESASFDDVKPWHVVEQEPEAGAPLEPGAEISLGVLRPSAVDGPRRVPSLLGLHADQADDVLRSIGLLPRPRLVPSQLPSGRVLQQSPAPGSELAAGGTVDYAITQRRISTTPVIIGMPDLRGVRLLDARVALLGRGLRARVGYQTAPEAPLGRIVAQLPRPGHGVAPGGVVHLVVPAEAVVPPVRGLERREAAFALQQAGLVPDLQGDLAGSEARVLAQNVAPGTRVARGSRVALRLAGTPNIRLVRVPAVTGLSARQAQRELEAAGLTFAFSGAAFGAGARRIVAQAPAEGTRVPQGTQIHLRYVWGALPGGPPSSFERVRVPNLVGAQLGAVQGLLQPFGLAAQVYGPPQGSGARIVRAQDPAAGTRVPRGTTLKVAYRWTGSLPVQQAPRVSVPGVVGRTVAAAQQLLQARGLQVRILGGGGGPTQVVAQQSPGAGVPSAQGGLVTLRLQPAPVRPQQPVVVLVSVPSVVGLPAAEAARRLQGLGLRARVVASGTPGSTVLRQGLTGQQVPRGTTIPIVVGSVAAPAHPFGKRKVEAPRPDGPAKGSKPGAEVPPKGRGKPRR